ncbi:MAG: translation elongation factor Ts [Treponema sp.]|nr:translation elongation factor Ts [Treponema sp.]
MDIKASDVKALRDVTGAGMMECKKALVEANGDAAAAEKILKEKGLAAVAKRADRATSEGRVFVRIVGNKAIMLELTTETDFVAKNADFIALGEKMLDVAFEKGYTEANDELNAMLTELATKIRENMTIGRMAVVDVPENSVVAKYVHSDFKTGALVVVSGSKDAKVQEFAYDCCLHLAAFAPAYIKQSDVPQSYIDEQKEIFVAQMKEDPKMASKPENVKEGILQGKIKKHLAEICFEDQMFVKDDKVAVSKKLEQIGKEVGANLTFNKIVLYILGK